MSEREMRTLLAEVIDDIDNGKLRVDRPRRLVLAGSLLAAAIGLGACQAQPKATRQKQNVIRVDAGPSQAMPPRPMDMGPVPEYAAPVMRPQPPKRHKTDQPIINAYAAPDTKD